MATVDAQPYEFEFQPASCALKEAALRAFAGALLMQARTA